MLNVEVLKQAYQDSHKECAEAPEGCLHAEALADRVKDFHDELSKCVEIALANGHDIGAFIANSFFHIGYRAAQLTYQPTPKDKVN